MENPTEETPPAVLETVTEEQKPVMEEEKPIVETPAPEAVQEAKVDQNPEVKAEVDVEMKEEAAKVGESTPEEAPSEVKTEESMEEPKAEEKTSEPIPEVATAVTDTISAEAVKSENAETVSKVDDLPPAEPPTSMHYIKIARIPKSVFDFMVKEEPEEGTVRLNLNQLKGFVTELLNSNAHVNSAIWDTCPYPALDLTVPANTPKNCIVQNFATSNLAENEKMIAEKMQRIKEQEIARYAKMNDEQKRTAWKEVNRQYVKKDNTIQRLGAAEQKKSKKESDVPSQIKPAEPLPGGQKADSKTVSKSTSQAKIGQVDLSPAVKNDNNRKRNQTNATSGASANKKPKQDSSPQKAKMVTTPVAKKTPQQSLQQKRQSLPNTPRQQQGGAGNKSFSSKKNGGGQPLHQQQRANNRQPDNNRPKRFSDNYADRNRRSQETMAAANPWGTPNPNIFGFIAPAQDPMSGYHAYPYQSSGAMGMQSSMNPFAAAPARDPYYDAHLADRERSMLERERRLMDQNYGGHQQQPQHPYSQPYGDREFRTTFDNYAAARGETPVFTRPEQPAYSTYGQDMNTSPYKNQQQPREYGRRY